MQLDNGKVDFASRIRFEGNAPDTDRVKCAIVVPHDTSKEDYGELVAEVRVFSRARPNYLQRGIFDIKSLNAGQARVKCAVVAGALAENVASVTKEFIDTSDAAKQAAKAWDAALAHFESGRSAPVPVDLGLSLILAALRKEGMLV